MRPIFLSRIERRAYTPRWYHPLVNVAVALLAFTLIGGAQAARRALRRIAPDLTLIAFGLLMAVAGVGMLLTSPGIAP